MTPKPHLLVIGTDTEEPAIVVDARAAGFDPFFERRYCYMGRRVVIERYWFIITTEDTFIRFIEWGQP